jgi:RNA polymerase sigma-70 factor (ECF subfamily)
VLPAPIVARYKGMVFGVAVARLRHFHDAEDVAQETFVRAYTRLGRLKEPARLGAWLRAIAIRCAIDHVKARENVSLDQVEEPAAPGPTALEALETEERRREVLDAIERLPPSQRETLTLYYLGGHSINQIAAIREAPLGTVKRRLHDARKRLREEMIDMVQEVFHEEAPGEEFADCVFETVNAYGKGYTSPWEPDRVVQVQQYAEKGFAGFTRALNTPHWRTRRDALALLEMAFPTHFEDAIELIKQCLEDTNKTVRWIALEMLLDRTGVSEDRIRGEFLPLILPMLFDRSREVRSCVAHNLGNWAADVPLETAARAVVAEPSERNLDTMRHLLQQVLEVQIKKETVS